MVVLVAEAAGVTARLVVDLVEGGQETGSSMEAVPMRLWTPPEYPNLAFPEQLNPVVAVPGWHPQFFDYLYLGFTNATA